MPEETINPKRMEVSRYNAQKHSILRETISDYEKANAEQVYNDLAEDLKPQGRLQELIVETLASNYVRLQRVAKAEVEMIKEAMSPDLLLKSLRSGNERYSADVPASEADKLLIYSRYQTATENRIYRALAVLKQLKAYEQSQDA